MPILASSSSQSLFQMQREDGGCGTYKKGMVTTVFLNNLLYSLQYSWLHGHVVQQLSNAVYYIYMPAGG